MEPAPACEGCANLLDCGFAWRTFECPGCGRTVPWCFGAADDQPELCDGCWYVLHEQEAKSVQGAAARVNDAMKKLWGAVLDSLPVDPARIARLFKQGGKGE